MLYNVRHLKHVVHINTNQLSSIFSYCSLVTFYCSAQEELEAIFLLSAFNHTVNICKAVRKPDDFLNTHVMSNLTWTLNKEQLLLLHYISSLCVPKSTMFMSFWRYHLNETVLLSLTDVLPYMGVCLISLFLSSIMDIPRLQASRKIHKHVYYVNSQTGKLSISQSVGFRNNFECSRYQQGKCKWL